MVKITFEITKVLDDKFRKSIAIRKGIRKGVIGQCLAEAIENWIKHKKNNYRRGNRT